MEDGNSGKHKAESSEVEIPPSRTPSFTAL